MGFLPGGISFYLMPGFTPSTAQFVHSNIISKEVCRVLVLQCRSTSHLTCFVSFHRVHLSYTIIQSYRHLQFLQSYKLHSYIHSYINTLTYSHTSYTPHHSYMIALVTGCILPFQFLLIMFQVVSPNQRTTWVYLFIMFQVLSPNQQTAWV